MYTYFVYFDVVCGRSEKLLDTVPLRRHLPHGERSGRGEHSKRDGRYAVDNLLFPVYDGRTSRDPALRPDPQL